MLGLKQKIFRSPFAFIQLELIPLEHASKNQFDFVARKPSSWAGIFATAKKYLRVAHGRQLILFFLVWRGLAKLVEAQAVEFIRICVDCGVRRDGV